jgi:hypothetical protein
MEKVKTIGDYKQLFVNQSTELLATLTKVPSAFRSRTNHAGKEVMEPADWTSQQQRFKNRGGVCKGHGWW